MIQNNVVVLASALLLSGCDSLYVIEGKIVVARGMPHASGAPALLCAGKGGPLSSSGIYGHPAYRVDTHDATIFCGPASRDVEFVLDEEIIQGGLPRLAHVYAWLEPVPAAKKLCLNEASALVQVDRRSLDHLVSPESADKPLGERARVTWPCGRNPTPTMPMAEAVTFDPDHKTWSEKLVEHRTLRIE